MAEETETLTEQTLTLDAVVNFDQLPDSAHVSQKTVQALLGCGSTSVWRWVKNGTLPKPNHFGRSVRWRVGDLRELLNKEAK